ncbi:MAG: glycosyltransferase family 2 protein [Spirochaetota bacterium]
MKKVYILLINYNGWKDTVACVDSIIKNIYNNYQIIIVDNNSTDGSVDNISNWIKKSFKNKMKFLIYNQQETDELTFIKTKDNKTSKEKFSPIIIIRSAFNNGFASGNNIGLKYGLSKGDSDYFWLLNNDTEIEKNSLSEMIQLAETDNNIGVVGSKLLFGFNHNIIQSLGNDHIGWNGVGHGSFDGISNNSKVPDYIRMKSVMGASFLIKNEVIKKIGLMDELYFMQVEEADWCIKASKAGYGVITNTKSIVIHKDGKSTERERIEKYLLGRKFFRTNIKDYLMWGYYSFRNEIYFVKKNFGFMFILYCLYSLPIKYIIKLLMIFVFNDDYKIKRIYLLNRAVFDGLVSNMGKVIDPLEWKQQFKL